jgi:hypothetical protein
LGRAEVFVREMLLATVRARTAQAIETGHPRWVLAPEALEAGALLARVLGSDENPDLEVLRAVGELYWLRVQALPVDDGTRICAWLRPSTSRCTRPIRMRCQNNCAAWVDRFTTTRASEVVLGSDAIGEVVDLLCSVPDPVEDIEVARPRAGCLGCGSPPAARWTANRS